MRVRDQQISVSIWREDHCTLISECLSRLVLVSVRGQTQLIEYLELLQRFATTGDVRVDNMHDQHRIHGLSTL